MKAYFRIGSAAAFAVSALCLARPAAAFDEHDPVEGQDYQNEPDGRLEIVDGHLERVKHDESVYLKILDSRNIDTAKLAAKFNTTPYALFKDNQPFALAVCREGDGKAAKWRTNNKAGDEAYWQTCDKEHQDVYIPPQTTIEITKTRYLSFSDKMTAADGIVACGEDADCVKKQVNALNPKVEFASAKNAPEKSKTGAAIVAKLEPSAPAPSASASSTTPPPETPSASPPKESPWSAASIFAFVMTLVAAYLVYRQFRSNESLAKANEEIDRLRLIPRYTDDNRRDMEERDRAVEMHQKIEAALLAAFLEDATALGIQFDKKKHQTLLSRYNFLLSQMVARLTARDTELRGVRAELDGATRELEASRQELEGARADLAGAQAALAEAGMELEAYKLREMEHAQSPDSSRGFDPEATSIVERPLAAVAAGPFPLPMGTDVSGRTSDVPTLIPRSFGRDALLDRETPVPPVPESMSEQFSAFDMPRPSRSILPASELETEPRRDIVKKIVKAMYPLFDRGEPVPLPIENRKELWAFNLLRRSPLLIPDDLFDELVPEDRRQLFQQQPVTIGNVNLIFLQASFAEPAQSR